jgi:DNA mismatch repair protein MSH6
MSQELMNSLDGAVGSARRALAGTSDLERSLARLAASVGGAAGAQGDSSSGGGFGREAAHVVLYEDMARRRVKVLVGAMKDLQGLQAALEAFQQVGGAAFGMHVSVRQQGTVITCASKSSAGREVATVHC